MIARLRAHLALGRRLVSWENRRFDARAGIDVGGVAEPAELTIRAGDPSTGFTYVATPVRLARFWLRELPGDPTTFTFVDMGSGKGRVLALAAAHGFGSVIGVEFAQELHDAAVANAARARERGLAFEPRLGDAAAFAFPGGPLVVHFNNPFAEPVLREVVANLARAYESQRPPIVVVYQQLTVEDEQHATTNLRILDDVPFLTGRTLVPRTLLDRRLLADFTVRVLASSEARALDAAQ